MGTTLHQTDGEADGGRRNTDRPVYVRSEDLGVISITPSACQETHEAHDELKARWNGVEEEM